MLPLYLLTSIKGQNIMIELKDGETINGKLLECDSRMNLTLTDATRMERTGTNAIHVKEIYVRGLQIKLLRMSNDIIDHYKEQQQQQQHGDNRRDNKRFNNDGRGNQRGNQRGNFNNRNHNSHDRYQRNNNNNNPRQRNNNNQKNNQDRANVTQSAPTSVEY